MSERTVRIEWLPDSPVEYKSDGIYITASAVRDVLTTSHLHCTWEVTRDGILDACGKTAVAIRFDEGTGELGEVCKHHANRMLVPLSFITEAASRLPQGSGTP